MAQVSGVRRVRIHDVFEGAPAERELETVVAGGSVYAVLETLCVDTPRVRLALADGEDSAAALRDLPGVLVRDVRVLWTVEDADGVLSGAPAWRLTLGADDDLVPVIALLSGESAAPAEPVVDVVDEPVVTDVAEPAPARGADTVDTVDPVDAAADDVAPVATVVPLLEPAPDRPAPVLAVVPSATPVVPLVPVASAPVVPVVEPVVAEVVVEPVVAEVVVEPVVAEVAEESPFALPAEEAFPVEAAEVVEPDVVEAAAEVDEPLVEEPEAAEPEATADEVGTVEDSAVASVVEEVEGVEAVVEAVPDPRDELFAPVAAVVAAGRPTCTGGDADGSCTRPADVVWQNEHGASWACSWHWPTSMAGYPGAEVGAVHLDGAWTTWRDGDGVDLVRRAADGFMDTVRDTGKPVARRLVALDTLDGLLAQLSEDVRGAVMLWAVAVTNPEWEPDAVAAHSATTLAEAAADGRAVAWPSELYFQEKAAPAPITPTAAGDAEEAPEVVEEPVVDGEKLFQQGNAAAATGDMRGASRLWTEAADKADHAGAMRALGDLATERDELKTAEEWYGRAAFLNDATSMTRIGVIYLQKGQSDRAAEWLRRAARFGDEEAVTHLQGLVPA